MATALHRRHTDPDVAEAVLDRLTEVGLVDDRAFAVAWVESRRLRKGLSVRALRAELTRRGVAREILDDVLAGTDPDEELAAAVALVRHKARTMTALAPEVRRRRLTGALARRGFTAEICRRALAEIDEPGIDEPGIDWSASDPGGG